MPGVGHVLHITSGDPQMSTADMISVLVGSFEKIFKKRQTSFKTGKEKRKECKEYKCIIL